MLKKYLQKSFVFFLILPFQVWGSSVLLSEGYLEILSKFSNKNSYFIVTLVEEGEHGGKLYTFELSQEARNLLEKSIPFLKVSGVDWVNEFSSNTEPLFWNYLTIIYQDHRKESHWETEINPTPKPKFIQEMQRALGEENIYNPLRVIRYINSKQLSNFLGYRLGINESGNLSAMAPDAEALNNNIKILNKHIELSEFKLPLSVYASRGNISSEDYITRFVRDRQIPLGPINRKSKFLHDHIHALSLLMISQKIFKSYQKLGRAVLLFSRYLDEQISLYMKSIKLEEDDEFRIIKANKLRALKEFKEKLLNKVVIQIDLLANVNNVLQKYDDETLEVEMYLVNMGEPMVNNKLERIIHDIAWNYLDDFPNIDDIEKGFFKRYPKFSNQSFLPKGVTHLGQLFIESRKQLDYLRQLELPTN